MKALIFFSAFVLAVSGGARGADTLDIYWVDVEGGAATLIVTPAGEALLMDAGYPRDDHRDVLRILDVMQTAGISKIDYFITSHFHRDHVGGLAELSRRVPIGRFVDHGDSVERDQERGRPLWESYLEVVSENRMVVKPGDEIPLEGVDVTIVASHSRLLSEPIDGGGPNEHCKDAELRDEDIWENGKSVGFLLSFGAFQFLDLGDLTWNFEHRMACPVNLVGKVDLYQVTHHGVPTSVPPQQVWALEPTVAVMNNGPRKGGHPDVFEAIAKSPNIEDIWQLHRSLETDDAHNTAEERIANLGESDDCRGHWVKASVASDGSFTVVNGRNGFRKTYASK